MVAHVTIEYIIMIPLLVLQIFLFPWATSAMMDIWVNARRELALKDAASNLESAIQQLYSSLSSSEISAGTIVYVPELPAYIEDCPFEATGYVYQFLNSSKILRITLKLLVYGNTADASVILGENVEWRSSKFISNSTDAAIVITKYSNGSLVFMFRS